MKTKHVIKKLAAFLLAVLLVAGQLPGTVAALGAQGTERSEPEEAAMESLEYRQLSAYLAVQEVLQDPESWENPQETAQGSLPTPESETPASRYTVIILEGEAEVVPTNVRWFDGETELTEGLDGQTLVSDAEFESLRAEAMYAGLTLRVTLSNTETEPLVFDSTCAFPEIEVLDLLVGPEDVEKTWPLAIPAECFASAITSESELSSALELTLKVPDPETEATPAVTLRYSAGSAPEAAEATVTLQAKGLNEDGTAGNVVYAEKTFTVTIDKIKPVVRLSTDEENVTLLEKEDGSVIYLKPMSGFDVELVVEVEDTHAPFEGTSVVTISGTDGKLSEINPADDVEIVDRAGNKAEVYSLNGKAFSETAVYIDLQAPYTDDSGLVVTTESEVVNGLFTGEKAEFSVTVTDGEGVGVERVEYAVTENPETVPETFTELSEEDGKYSISIALLEKAEYTNYLYVRAIDRLNNLRSADVTIKVDNLAPRVSIELPDKKDGREADDRIYYNAEQTVTVSVEDANPDTASIVYLLNGEEKTLALENGEAQIAVKNDEIFAFQSATAVDKAGHENTLTEPDSGKATTFAVDTVAPKLTLSAEGVVFNRQRVDGDVTVTVWYLSPSVIGEDGTITITGEIHDSFPLLPTGQFAGIKWDENEPNKFTWTALTYEKNLTYVKLPPAFAQMTDKAGSPLEGVELIGKSGNEDPATLAENILTGKGETAEAHFYVDRKEPISLLEHGVEIQPMEADAHNGVYYKDKFEFLLRITDDSEDSVVDDSGANIEDPGYGTGIVEVKYWGDGIGLSGAEQTYADELVLGENEITGSVSTVQGCETTEAALYASVKDAVGNIATYSLRDLKIDRKAPEITIDVPEGGCYDTAKDVIVTVKDLNFDPENTGNKVSFTVSEEESDREFSDKNLWEPQGDGSWKAVFTFSDQPEDTRLYLNGKTLEKVTCVVYDSLYGEDEPFSAYQSEHTTSYNQSEIGFTVDTTAPTAELTVPEPGANGAVRYYDEEQTITLLVCEPNLDKESSKLTVEYNNDKENTEEILLNSDKFEVDSDENGDKTFTLTVGDKEDCDLNTLDRTITGVSYVLFDTLYQTAADKENHFCKGEQSTNFRVDTTAPTAELTVPESGANGAVRYYDEEQTITLSVREPNLDKESSKLTVEYDGNPENAEDIFLNSGKFKVDSDENGDKTFTLTVGDKEDCDLDTYGRKITKVSYVLYDLAYTSAAEENKAAHTADNGDGQATNFCVDTKQPELVSFDVPAIDEADTIYFDAAQTITLRVREVNLDKESSKLAVFWKEKEEEEPTQAEGSPFGADAWKLVEGTNDEYELTVTVSDVDRPDEETGCWINAYDKMISNVSYLLYDLAYASAAEENKAAHTLDNGDGQVTDFCVDTKRPELLSFDVPARGESDTVYYDAAQTITLRVREVNLDKENSRLTVFWKENEEDEAAQAEGSPFGADAWQLVEGTNDEYELTVKVSDLDRPDEETGCRINAYGKTISRVDFTVCDLTDREDLVIAANHTLVGETETNFRVDTIAPEVSIALTNTDYIQEVDGIEYFDKNGIGANEELEKNGQYLVLRLREVNFDKDDPDASSVTITVGKQGNETVYIYQPKGEYKLEWQKVEDSSEEYYAWILVTDEQMREAFPNATITEGVALTSAKTNVTDRANNASSSDLNLEHPFIVDTTPPKVTITPPPQQDCATTKESGAPHDFYNSEQSIEIKVVSTNFDKSHSEIKVTVQNGSELGTLEASEVYTFNCADLTWETTNYNNHTTHITVSDKKENADVTTEGKPVVKIEASVIDYAKHTTKGEAETDFIVDTTKPTIEFKLPTSPVNTRTEDKVDFYNKTQEIKIVVTETNFDQGKDKLEFYVAERDEPFVFDSLNWDKTGSNVYTATATVSDEQGKAMVTTEGKPLTGIKATIKDYALYALGAAEKAAGVETDSVTLGNDGTATVKTNFIVDTTKPTVTFALPDSPVNRLEDTTDFYAQMQTIEITVTETNFDQNKDRLEFYVAERDEPFMFDSLSWEKEKGSNVYTAIVTVSDEQGKKMVTTEGKPLTEIKTTIKDYALYALGAATKAAGIATDSVTLEDDGTATVKTNFIVDTTKPTVAFSLPKAPVNTRAEDKVDFYAQTQNVVITVTESNFDQNKDRLEFYVAELDEPYVFESLTWSKTESNVYTATVTVSDEQGKAMVTTEGKPLTGLKAAITDYALYTLGAATKAAGVETDSVTLESDSTATVKTNFIVDTTKPTIAFSLPKSPVNTRAEDEVDFYDKTQSIKLVVTETNFDQAKDRLEFYVAERDDPFVFDSLTWDKTGSNVYTTTVTVSDEQGKAMVTTEGKPLTEIKTTIKDYALYALGAATKAAGVATDSVTLEDDGTATVKTNFIVDTTMPTITFALPDSPVNRLEDTTDFYAETQEIAITVTDTNFAPGISELEFFVIGEGGVQFNCKDLTWANEAGSNVYKTSITVSDTNGAAMVTTEGRPLNQIKATIKDYAKNVPEDAPRSEQIPGVATDSVTIAEGIANVYTNFIVDTTNPTLTAEVSKNVAEIYKLVEGGNNVFYLIPQVRTTDENANTSEAAAQKTFTVTVQAKDSNIAMPDDDNSKLYNLDVSTGSWIDNGNGTYSLTLSAETDINKLGAIQFSFRVIDLAGNIPGKDLYANSPSGALSTAFTPDGTGSFDLRIDRRQSSSRDDSFQPVIEVQPNVASITTLPGDIPLFNGGFTGFAMSIYDGLKSDADKSFEQSNNIGLSKVSWSLTDPVSFLSAGSTETYKDVRTQSAADGSVYNTIANPVYSKSYSIGIAKAGANETNDAVLHITVEDNAGNIITKDYPFAVDNLAPRVRVEYNNNDVANEKYFKASRTAEIRVTDLNFNPDYSPTLYGITTEVGAAGWTESTNNTWVTRRVYNTDGDYTFRMWAADKATNRTEDTSVDYRGQAAPKEFTVDLTAPVIEISYDEQGAFRNEHYYNDNVTARITVTEHNFRESDVVYRPSGNLQGVAVATPELGSFSMNSDAHVATAVFSEDGNYTVEAEYTDLAGNPAETAVGSLFTVDKTPPVAEITGLNRINVGAAAPSITFTDINFDQNAYTYEMRFTNSLQAPRVVTEQFLTLVSPIDNGVLISSNDLPHQKQYDGVYTITASLTDLAGNTTFAESKTGSVNRFGSTFYTDDDATQRLASSGISGHAMPLKVIEISPNEITSYEITLMVGGRTIILTEGTDYRVEQNNKDGIYQNIYWISESAFEENGVLREGRQNLIVNTQDAAGYKNSSSTNADLDGNILRLEFVLDATRPLASINGVQDGDRIQESSLNVDLYFSDDHDVATLELYLNGELIESWDEETLAEFNGMIPYTFYEDARSQTIKLVVTDSAGNSYETDEISFYLNSNFFLQFINQPIAVIGTGAGLVVIGGGILLLRRRRKNRIAVG